LGRVGVAAYREHLRRIDEHKDLLALATILGPGTTAQKDDSNQRRLCRVAAAGGGGKIHANCGRSNRQSSFRDLPMDDDQPD